MALFKLPLSGDVVQWINPMTWFMSGNQVNVYLGESSAPEVEAEILDRVGTYGKQLGQVSDALIVLLKYLPARESLSPSEQAAIAKFKEMARRRDRQGETQAAGTAPMNQLALNHKQQSTRAYHVRRCTCAHALLGILHQSYPQPEHAPCLCAPSMNFLRCELHGVASIARCMSALYRALDARFGNLGANDQIEPRGDTHRVRLACHRPSRA